MNREALRLGTKVLVFMGSFVVVGNVVRATTVKTYNPISMGLVMVGELAVGTYVATKVTKFVVGELDKALLTNSESNIINQ